SLNPVATLPKASSARTFTAGVICWPATVVLGCVPNTSWLAAPGVILKPLLVAFNPAAVAASQAPVAVVLLLLSTRAEERRAGEAVVVPWTVLPSGLLPRVSGALPVKHGPVF